MIKILGEQTIIRIRQREQDVDIPVAWSQRHFFVIKNMYFLFL